MAKDQNERTRAYQDRQRAAAFGQTREKRKKEKKMAIDSGFGFRGGVLEVLEMEVRLEDGKWVMHEKRQAAQRQPPKSREQLLEDSLHAAQKQIADANRTFQQIGEAAGQIGVVVELPKDGVLVSVGGAVMHCHRTPQLAAELGATVKLHAQTKQIVAVGPPRLSGHIARVVSVDDATLAIMFNGMERVVARADTVGDVKPGDNVLVDETAQVACRRLPKDDAAILREATGVAWDDIGGLEAAKEAIREAIEYPIRYADLYRGYGKAPDKGVLLYGPPGCGKTMIGKATATAIRDAHGSTEPGGFIYVKGPQLLNKFVGATEEAIRKLFAQAREYKAKTGHAAVLFIDEADALLAARGSRHMGMEGTVVPMFLAEMDGLQDSAAFVMLATNRADSLDPAITRDGRIDRKIEIGRPDRTSAATVLRLALRRAAFGQDVDVEQLVTDTVDLMYADETVVKTLRQVEIRLPDGQVKTQPIPVRLRDAISGAVVAGIANRATNIALRRDRLCGADEPSGLSLDDMRAAVAGAARELAGTDLRHEAMTAIDAVQQAQNALEMN